jgi:hypothetical protein
MRGTMKLTDPDIIKEGEKDLIDAIKDDLDLDSINEIIKEKLKIKNLKSKGGKIIVHNNEVAFKIDFELSLNGSLMFDRNGNHIPDDDDKADIDDSNADSKSDSDETEIDKADETDEEKSSDVDASNDASDEPEIEISKDEVEAEKDDSEDVDEIDLGEDVENIAQELIAEDDLTEDALSDDSDSSASSELDLDVGPFEDSDEGEDEIDFSDDEDIDEILKESRDFWEKKKK